MTAEARHEQEQADAALQHFYQRYGKALSTEQRKLFTKANARWLSYRNAYCEFQASGAAGGSAYPMVHAYCMAEQASTRLKMLRQSLARVCRQEGDVSCPAPGADLFDPEPREDPR